MTGRAAPTSTRDLAAFDELETHTYADAMRYLARDDLADLGITHVHVTEAALAAMSPAARAMLTDGDGFRELFAVEGPDGERHAVYAYAAGGGAPETDSGSYRRLFASAEAGDPAWVSPAATKRQHEILLLGLSRESDVHGVATHITRASVHPEYAPIGSEVPGELTIIPDWLVPTRLRLDRADALWQGDGMSAYDAQQKWTGVMRVGTDAIRTADDLRTFCTGEDRAAIDVRALGDPGGHVLLGSASLDLLGHVVDRHALEGVCASEQMAAPGVAVAPFIQIRPSRAAVDRDDGQVAGLAFDGGVDGTKVVVNLWYRNPRGEAFDLGTELRLYRADAAGVGPATSQLSNSVRWWEGPLVLSADVQTARIEFDGASFRINGSPGAGSGDVRDGETYILALTIAGLPEGAGELVFQAVVPLVVLRRDGAAPTYEVLSGIVDVRPRRDPDASPARGVSTRS